MVPKTLLLLAALHAAQADSSHELFYKTVDSKTHLGIRALRGRGLAGTESPAVNEQGFWFSRFAIGDSPDLEILIDTGSSDAILNPGIYKPSSNAVDSKRTFHISYATTNPDGTGDLSASGTVHRDTITQLSANITVANQTLGAITWPSSPPTFPHDGLIGYAGPSSSALRGSSFIASLCAQGTLSACRFGLALYPSGRGSLHYGAVPTDLFAGRLTSVEIEDEWAVSGDVLVDGKPVRSDVSIITDSGTTVVFGPVDQVTEVFDKAGLDSVSKEDGVVTGYYNCSAPPSIGFSIGGTRFDMLPEALALSRDKDGDNCTASVRGTSEFGDNWLVGQAFFQGRYVDHDVDGRTMGFANLK